MNNEQKIEEIWMVTWENIDAIVKNKGWKHVKS